MQIEHRNVDFVKPDDDFAIKVIEPVREHDVVYKVAGGKLVVNPPKRIFQWNSSKFSKQGILSEFM